MGTKIPWTDETWNFSGGCKPVSEGCANCAAARLASGRLKNHPLYKGLTKNGRWTGEIRTCLDIGRPDIFEKPLHWREPRMVFPCFMGDLFNLPFEFQVKVFNVIRRCPQHTFQVLTKHPERLVQIYKEHPDKDWPIAPNLWLGVSVENNANLWRIEELLKIQAAVRFVSFEPLLGGIDIRQYLKAWGDPFKEDRRITPVPLDQIIVGCESGPKRRPCKIEWVRDLVEQCKAASVPIFVKQLSINGKVSHKPDEWPEWARLREFPKVKDDKSKDI